MLIKNYKYIIILMLLITVMPSQAKTSPYIFYRNFWNPIYHGKLLNYCSQDKQQCGLQLASIYCHLMGYQHADRAIIAYNIGCTNYIVNHKIRLNAACCDWWCNGFKLIRCVNILQHSLKSKYYYRLRHFIYPRFNNKRVAWCYDGKTGCGYKAAFSFCRRIGYMQVKHYTIDYHVNITKTIGNQKFCIGSKCRGFKDIDCFR